MPCILALNCFLFYTLQLDFVCFFFASVYATEVLLKSLSSDCIKVVETDALYMREREKQLLIPLMKYLFLFFD